ncbi:MAG: hypothetical protein ACM3S4_11790 [Burkholderiales bacterium]
MQDKFKGNYPSKIIVAEYFGSVFFQCMPGTNDSIARPHVIGSFACPLNCPPISDMEDNSPKACA